MQSRTLVLPLNAPKVRVFRFLSKIENLPTWATGFCKGLKVEGGRHKIVTPNGEIFFRIEADETTGVIDMFGGPSEEQMAYWPTRVVDRPGHGSLFIFTSFRYPGMRAVEFTRQCATLEREEFPHIKRHTEVEPAGDPEGTPGAP
jgi:hypothetical protein